MNILQINMEKGWRGGESQTLLCMEQFRQAGHEVELLARRHSELAQRASAKGFKVHTQKSAALAVLFFLLGRAAKYDIIHCQTANSLTWPALFKGLFKAKLVYTRRTAFPIKAHKEKSTRLKWRNTDLFVANTQAGMAEALRIKALAADAVQTIAELKPQAHGKGPTAIVIPSATIPQSFDAARFSDIIEQHHLQGKKIIAVIAALTEEKEPLLEIEAIHQLFQRRQDIAVLHFGTGKLLPSCQQKVQALGLAPNYVFMGFQHQVEQLFQGFDCYLLTSRHEGANNGIINAFFNEVPVVSTACGGPNELIGQHNERGYLCPVGDAKTLAEALYLALEQSPENAARIQAAKDYALQNHTVETMAKHYLTAFEALLGRS
ncbi:hypothetical protein HMPREF3144_09615 [Oligella sp. HMSC05A10]|uniref:glycosyltransferase n=1 Tax=Oligella sp. HMSC05A10 TaxID=1581112 RepID=UPI0008A46C1F|nr:glycosyltransferase [Oligella sp. HMSC05A10]OFS83129.1 hypothetical protein HMPREF3144_09615 [Oligella sp. HMSC05A10]